MIPPPGGVCCRGTERAGGDVMADDLLERGMGIYEERLKSLLEPEHKGEMLAVEVESGDYFLGRTATEAYKKAKEEYPGREFAFLRVGARAAFFVGAS